MQKPLNDSKKAASEMHRVKLGVDLELDTIVRDLFDQFLIPALDGDDLVTIDFEFSNIGSVDRGNGSDLCTATAEWTTASC